MPMLLSYCLVYIVSPAFVFSKYRSGAPKCTFSTALYIERPYYPFIIAAKYLFCLPALLNSNLHALLAVFLPFSLLLTYGFIREARRGDGFFENGIIINNTYIKYESIRQMSLDEIEGQNKALWQITYDGAFEEKLIHRSILQEEQRIIDSGIAWYEDNKKRMLA